MSAAVASITAGPAGPAEVLDGRPPRRRGRRAAVAGLVVVLVAAGAAVAVTDPFAGAGRSDRGAAGNGYATSLATVTEGTLSAQTQVDATLGYAGSYTVRGEAGGTITWLPAAGAVIRQGRVLYRVDDGSPVFLLYGTVPAWRALSEGMTGADVRQLNHDLVALGYAASAELDPGSDYFSAETAYVLGLLQARLGLAATGSLPLGQAVFLPSALRVTAVQGALGSPAAGPVLAGSSTARLVRIALDAAQQTELKAGDRVSVTLPDGSTTPGVVSSVGTVATAAPGGGTSKVTVEVTLPDPAAAGSLDQAPVQVSITTASVRDALAVPVDALLALASGYAVEEATAAGGRRLVPVSLGLFDDASGLVQVSGAGLAAGQHVVVPAI